MSRPQWPESTNSLSEIPGTIHIKVDCWSLEDVKFISQRDYETFCQRIKPEIGDVLYTKRGTTGVARAVDLDYPFQVWVHVAVLKLKKTRIFASLPCRNAEYPAVL